MPAHQGQVGAGQAQHRSDQQSELAIAQHDDPIRGPDVRPAPGSRRRPPAARRKPRPHPGRDRARRKLAWGSSSMIGQGAIAADDAQGGAVGAMGMPAGQAGRAGVAGGVDVAHHTAADPGRIGRLDDLADEFVPQHAAKRHVAAHQLQIGVADAGQPHAHQRLTGRRRRVGIAGSKRRPLSQSEGRMGLSWKQDVGQVGTPVLRICRHDCYDERQAQAVWAFLVPSRFLSSQPTSIGTALKIEE